MLFSGVLLLLLLLLSHFSRVQLCATPETAAHQAPPSLGFSRQEHWSGLPFPSPMHESEQWKWSRSVVSDSVRPHGLQPTRLLRPWDLAGKSTGVGCHCLLQIKSTKGNKNRKKTPKFLQSHCMGQHWTWSYAILYWTSHMNLKLLCVPELNNAGMFFTYVTFEFT